NHLSGTIPPELGNLSNLKWLVLPWNELTGVIPSTLGNLSNLKWLYLNDNQLTGVIPPEFDNLSGLEGLYLDHNELSGAIPSALGHLSNLEGVYLSHNHYSSFHYFEPFFAGPQSSSFADFRYAPQHPIPTFTGADHPDLPEETLWVADSGQYSQYQWHKNEVAISGATDAVYTPTLDPTDPIHDYHCVVTNTWVTDLTLTSEKRAFDAPPPHPEDIPLPVITAPSRSCVPATATLTATAEGGGTITWYAFPSGGAPLGTGPTYTTPEPLTGNTYFYATQTVLGAESSRAVGLVAIGPPYEKPQDTTICRGEPVQLYAYSTEEVTLAWEQIGAMESFV
ncbi:MAG: hypothetical protein AAF649_13590, partial [Verrucomicrobiota bacterium]